VWGLGLGLSTALVFLDFFGFPESNDTTNTQYLKKFLMEHSSLGTPARM